MKIKNYELLEQKVFANDGMRSYKISVPYVVLVSESNDIMVGTVEKYVEKGDSDLVIEIHSSVTENIETVFVEFQSVAIKNGFCSQLSSIMQQKRDLESIK